MDPETIGSFGAWLGIIVGGACGLVGGLVGTFFAIANTRSREERAFVVQASILCWIFVTAFVAALLLIPTWHKHLLWIPYAVLLVWGIRVWNKRQVQIRGKQETPSG